MSATALDTTVMKRILEEALDFGGQKAGHKGVEETLGALKRGDCSICEYVRYGLAQQVAQYLGSVDRSVKAVYTYEPEYATGVEGSVPNRPSLSPAISMIAWVDHKSAALTSVVSILGSAVSEELQRLGCPKANALCHMLDVRVVDDTEVLGRTGYGALIDSVYVRPTEVWRR